MEIEQTKTILVQLHCNIWTLIRKQMDDNGSLELEKLITEDSSSSTVDEKVVESNESELRSYIVTNIAANTFYQPCFFLIEYGLAGWEFEKSLKARGCGLLMGLGLNWVYDKYRKAWSKLCKTDADSSRLKKFIVDTLGNIVFMLPISLLICYLVDADTQETAIATTLSTIFSLSSGRPYGFWLDNVKKYFGIKPTLEKGVD